MPLKTVPREVITIRHKLVALVCNCCGKVSGEGHEGLMGFHVIRLQGGYGDHFPGDMENLEIVVCEECLKAWVGTFKHPDVCDGSSGLGPGPDPIYECKHSEDLSPMRAEWPFLYPEGVTESEIEEPTDEEMEELECPDAGTVWSHFKGNRYLVLYGVVYHALTGEPFVIYQGLYEDGDIWARPLIMWDDQVDKPGYTGPRFKLMGYAEQ